MTSSSSKSTGFSQRSYKSPAKSNKCRDCSAQLPTYFLSVVFAGWLNRQQQAAIDYLKTENEILESQRAIPKTINP